MPTEVTTNRRRNSLIAYGLAAAWIVADQLSKLWVLGSAFPNACPGYVARPGATAAQDFPCSIDVLPIFDLTSVWNRGVSFGLLQGQADIARWMLVGFSLLVAGGLVWWARRADRLITALAFGLIIGGAVGNVIDRVRFGAVADFIDVSGLGFFPWIFNVADSGITIGVILLLLEGFLPKRKPAEPAA